MSRIATLWLSVGLSAAGLCAPLAAAGPSGQAAATEARRIFDRDGAPRLVPLLLEAVRFPTVAGNAAAFAAQQAWLERVAGELGLVFRDAGPVEEIELPGPDGGPVLGLVVHGDVQPVDAAEWSTPPFAGVERDGSVWGRGAADDKGPLVQALLAMSALAASGAPRTHTVRLLVGSDEESANLDMKTYLATHRAPDVSLVIDSSFPVVVGEKAWNALTVTVAEPFVVRSNGGDAALSTPWALEGLEAGLSTSIVPSRAVATLRWQAASLTGVPAAIRALTASRADGLTLEAAQSGHLVSLTARGRAAHAGLNLEGGRNAVVFLAQALAGKIAPSGAADLLDFAALAGRDLYGGGLGLTSADPLWGRYAVNVATIQKTANGELALTTNVRRPPPLRGPELRARLESVVAEFNARRGAHLQASGFYDDEPLVLEPDSALVRRLLGAYTRATGESAEPAVSGGSTYAKRMPHAIAFGMWFPGRPYPGHDVDEHIPVRDLLRGTHVLIEALADLATTAPVAIGPEGQRK